MIRPVPGPSGLALVAVCAVLAGCVSPDRAQSAPPSPAWHAEGFPDLPLPELVGYRPEAGTTPLALSYAFGDLRRFDVLFAPRDGDAGEDPQEAIDRLASAFARLGWTRVPLPAPASTPGQPASRTSSAERSARFRKGRETALLTCRGTGSGSRIHLVVEPDA